MNGSKHITLNNWIQSEGELDLRKSQSPFYGPFVIFIYLLQRSELPFDIVLFFLKEIILTTLIKC